MDILPDEMTFRRLAAEEAVSKLVLLRPEAVETVFKLLENPNGLHPKAICTAYRKEGEQLSPAEKGLAGIRRTAFMSRKALGEISPLGMQDPVRAHELTVLRGSFAIFRHSNALAAEGVMREHTDLPITVQYDVFHPESCSVCASLDGELVGPDWGLFAPDGCTCVTAPYGLRVYADFFAQVIEREKR